MRLRLRSRRRKSEVEMGYIIFDVDRSYKSRRRERLSRFFSFFFAFLFLGLSLISFKGFRERGARLNEEVLYATQEIDELSREQREMSKIVASLKRKQKRIRGEIDKKREVIEAVNDVEVPITEMMNRVERVVEGNDLLVEDFSLKEGALYLYMRTPEMETGKILNSFSEEFSKVVLKEKSKNRTIIKVEGINEERD